MTRFNIRTKGEDCALYVDGSLLVSGSWGAFDALAQAMRRIVRGVSTYEADRGVEMRADVNGVVLSIGRWSSAATLEEFAALAQGIHTAARTAESQNNDVLNQQVADGALLARARLPFGLSDNPRVKDEIGKVAATDSTLRRAIPFTNAAKIPGVPRVRHVSNGETLKILHAQHAQMRKELYGQAS